MFGGKPQAKRLLCTSLTVWPLKILIGGTNPNCGAVVRSLVHCTRLRAPNGIHTSTISRLLHLPVPQRAAQKLKKLLSRSSGDYGMFFLQFGHKDGENV